MLTITTARYGRPFLNVHFQPSSQWKRFFGTSRTPEILEISRYYTSCFISRARWIPLWTIGTHDHDNHLNWECQHWQKDHFWTKSYQVASVANNGFNPLIFCMSMLHDKSSWCSQSNSKENVWLLSWKETLKLTSIKTGTKLGRGIM